MQEVFYIAKILKNIAFFSILCYDGCGGEEMLLLKQTNELGNRLLKAEVAQKTCFPSHMHDHFELELILEGSGSFTVNAPSTP